MGTIIYATEILRLIGTFGFVCLIWIAILFGIDWKKITKKMKGGKR